MTSATRLSERQWGMLEEYQQKQDNEALAWYDDYLEDEFTVTERGLTAILTSPSSELVKEMEMFR